MALRCLWRMLRRPPPEPVFPLTFLRDSLSQVFMHIVYYVDMAGLIALARADRKTYDRVLPILMQEKRRAWHRLYSVDVGREPLYLSLGNVSGWSKRRVYCLCRRSCERKPCKGDVLNDIFPVILRMRHDLRRNDVIAVTSPNRNVIFYVISACILRFCCDDFPLELYSFKPQELYQPIEATTLIK